MKASEEMRNDLRRVINNYGTVTVIETLGVLELLKAEHIERLRTSTHPDAQAPEDKPNPDL